MAKKIAIGYDGSEGSKKAFAEAIRIAILENAQLYIISIEELPRYPVTMGEVIEEQKMKEDYLHKLHKEAITTAIKAGLARDHIITEIKVGHPARSLVDYVTDTGIDLLIIGHSGHSGIWGTFLGTTADKVIRHVTCSVLVIR